MNRFTQYSPREFQQTYQPLPIDQMIQLGQIGQRRNDAIDSAIGKAAGDMSFEGGLATQELASTVTKEYNDQLNALSDSWGNDRNSSAVIQGLSKLKQQMASDPRIKFAQQDRALMPEILKQQADPLYGVSKIHKAYDPATNQYNIGDINQMIASGQVPSYQNYGYLENVGAETAWGKTIDTIKPDILQGFTKNEDGSYSSKEGSLDMDTVLRRSEGILSGLSSDGKHLNNLENLDPSTQGYINYMKEAYRRDGKEYDYDAALNDFKNQAALRLQIKQSQGITDEDGKSGKGSKGKIDETSIVGASLGPTTLIDASNPTFTEIADGGYKKAVEATGFDYFTLKDADGMSAFDYVYNEDYTLPLADRDAARQSKREFDIKQYNTSYQKILDKKKEEFKPEKVTVNGKTHYVKKKSDREIEQLAHEETMGKLEKRRILGSVALDVALELGEEKIPKYDDDGNIVGLSKEEVSDIETWNKKLANKDLNIKSVKQADSYEYSDLKIPKGYEIVAGNLVPERYEEYFTALNNKTKEAFSNRNFSAIQYSLYSKNDGELLGSEIPVNQKQIIEAAKTLAKLPESHVYYNGKAVNALNTKGSSTKGHSMDQLYLSGTSPSDDEVGDFTKGKTEFVPFSIYWNKNVNKWLSRGQYEMNGVDGENDLQSAIYEVDVTHTLSDLMSGDQNMQVMMKDAVSDALSSVPKGTSGVANIGMTDKQLEQFGDIHIIHNADGTYDISGNVMYEGEKQSIKKVIRENDERNLDPNSLNETDANDIVFNAWLNQNRNIEAEKGEVISKDFGLMQINDATWKKPENRDFSSVGGTDWSEVSFDDIASDPQLNIKFAADIVRNTPNGWTNWSTYNNALEGNPNSNWKSTYEKIKEDGGWFALQNGKHKDLISEIRNNYGDDYMTNIGKPNSFGLNDTQMAFLVMMAESNGNPNAVGKNFKK